MVIQMTSVQINARTSQILLDEIDTIVEKGLFRNRTEAINEALRMLVRRYKVMKVAAQIESMSLKDSTEKSLTEALLSSREEEDS